MMLTRRWTVAHGRDTITLSHENKPSLKTRASLFANGVLIARTGWRWHLLPVRLAGRLPGSDTRVEATVGYARNGFSRVHWRRVDGRIVDGVETVPDILSERYPEEGYARAVLVRGGPPALIYTILMFASGVFSPEAPRAALAGGGLFWLVMGSFGWLMGRWVSADRRRQPQGGSESPPA